MTFTRYNPSGYADGDDLPAACVNQLDLNLSRALDGFAGGSYAPSSAIVIGGSGLSVSGNFACGNAVLTGTVGYGASSDTTFAAGAAVHFESGATLGMGLRGNATCTAYERTVFVNASTHGYGSTTFVPIISANNVHWEQTVDTAASVYIPTTCVPTVAAITGIAIQLKGASGHAGLPGTMPVLALVKQTADGATMSVESSVTDASDNTTAYQTTHPLSITGLNVNPITYVWMVRITGESGANALVGLEVYSVAFTWSTNSIGL